MGVAKTGGDLGDGDNVASVALDELYKERTDLIVPGEGDRRKKAHLFTKLAEDVLRVKVDESITKNDRHLVN